MAAVVAARYFRAAWTAEGGRPHTMPNEILAYCQAGAIVGDHFQLLDVGVGFSGHYGVDAAGVVADHPADGAGFVTGGIDLEDARHVLREIEYDGDVAALAGEGGASAATKQRGGEFAADGDCGEDVVGVVRENYADGDLTVVGAIGGVKGAGAVVEADFATNLFTQSLGESRGF